MKFNAKQLENVARVIGSVASAAIIGAAIGLYRPAQISLVEEISLITAAVILLISMVHLLKETK